MTKDDSFYIIGVDGGASKTKGILRYNSTDPLQPARRGRGAVPLHPAASSPRGLHVGQLPDLVALRVEIA